MPPTNLDSPPPLLVVSLPHHVTHVYGFPGNREERWISGKMGGGREEKASWLDARRRSCALLSLHILYHRLQHFIVSASSSLSACLFKSSGGAAVMELSHTASPAQSRRNKWIYRSQEPAGVCRIQETAGAPGA